VTDRPRLSLGLPPSPQIVAHARAAEDLGYHRLWVFDSPALYTDLWVALARVAEQTETIGLATGVAIPSLRHPMVTASAIATIEELSPGRLIVAFGTGYTGRIALGRRPMAWSDVARYVRQVRSLLGGEVTEIDGKACQMVHSPGFAPARPITTPIWVAPSGPKGFAVARELRVPGVVAPVDFLGGSGAGDGGPWGEAAGLVFGSVVRPGEDHRSRRLMEAAGPSYAASFHSLIEFAPAMLDDLPGGAAWRSAISQERPETERHLVVHQGHLCVVSDRDRPLVESAGPAILQSGWTGDAASIAARLERAGADGVSEIVYVPAGPDIGSELEAFATAAGRSGTRARLVGDRGRI